MTHTRLGQMCAETRSVEEVLVPRITKPVFSTTYAKTGSYSAKCTATIGIGFSQISRVEAGCHYLIEEFGAAGYYPLYLSARDDNSVIHGLQFDSSAEIAYLYFDGSPVSSKSFAELGITEETWLHCAIKFDGNTGELSAWVDTYDRSFSYTDSGVSQVNVNSVWSGASGTSKACYIDNMYADQWDTDSIDIRPPKKHFFYKTPTANGSFNDWTPVGVASNWQAVDEAPHNGDTDYNHADAGDLVDTFDTTSISIPESDDATIWLPRAVIPRALAKRNDATQDASLRVLAYDGANFEYGDLKEYIGPGYQYWWSRMTNQPDGNLWTEDDINAMEYGYTSKGTFA